MSFERRGGGVCSPGEQEERGKDDEDYMLFGCLCVAVSIRVLVCIGNTCTVTRLSSTCFVILGCCCFAVAVLVLVIDWFRST